MRLTKQDLIETNNYLRAQIHEKEQEINVLKGRLLVYEKLTSYFTVGTIAIEKTCDAVAHVLTDLKRKTIL